MRLGKSYLDVAAVCLLAVLAGCAYVTTQDRGWKATRPAATDTYYQLKASFIPADEVLGEASPAWNAPNSKINVADVARSGAKVFVKNSKSAAVVIHYGAGAEAKAFPCFMLATNSTNLESAGTVTDKIVAITKETVYTGELVSMTVTAGATNADNITALRTAMQVINTVNGSIFSPWDKLSADQKDALLRIVEQHVNRSDAFTEDFDIEFFTVRAGQVVDAHYIPVLYVEDKDKVKLVGAVKVYAEHFDTRIGKRGGGSGKYADVTLQSIRDKDPALAELMGDATEKVKAERAVTGKLDAFARYSDRLRNMGLNSVDKLYCKAFVAREAKLTGRMLPPELNNENDKAAINGFGLVGIYDDPVPFKRINEVFISPQGCPLCKMLKQATVGDMDLSLYMTERVQLDGFAGSSACDRDQYRTVVKNQNYTEVGCFNGAVLEAGLAGLACDEHQCYSLLFDFERGQSNRPMLRRVERIAYDAGLIPQGMDCGTLTSRMKQ